MSKRVALSTAAATVPNITPSTPLAARFGAFDLAPTRSLRLDGNLVGGSGLEIDVPRWECG
jgi:hypothetical protein